MRLATPSRGKRRQHTGLRLEGVRSTKHSATRLDGVEALKNYAKHGAGLHVLDQAGEEGLVPEIGIVCDVR